MHDPHFVLPLLKMQAWQRAKGELNAMADAQFQKSNGALNANMKKYENKRWFELREKIENFIDDIEKNDHAE